MMSDPLRLGLCLPLGLSLCVEMMLLAQQQAQ
jgi:hypothetical protein